MSADNYGVIHRTEDGKFGLVMGFASDDHPVDLTKPYFTADTLTEVVEFANGEYFEYGWSFEKSLQDSLLEESSNDADELINKVVELKAKVLEYEHALEHIADKASHQEHSQVFCTECVKLAQGALDGVNREMCREMVLEERE